MTSCTREEMETIVNWNEAEERAEVYTASQQTMRKLDTLCNRFPDAYRCLKRSEHQATYSCPKDRIRFAPPPSAAQIEAGRLKIAKMRGNKPESVGVSESA